MNSKIEKVLEFSKIRTQLAEYATSEKGKQMIKELPIEVEAKAIQNKIEETTEGVELLRLKQGIPIPRLKDISFALKRLELEAGLNGRELSDIQRVLTTTHEVERFFEKVEEEEIALKRVPRLVEKLESIPDVTSELEASIREDGYVLDSASPTLHGVRVGIQKTEQDTKQHRHFRC